MAEQIVADIAVIGAGIAGVGAKPDGARLFVSPADQDPVEPHDAFADDMVLAEGLYPFEQAVTITVTHVERSWAD